MYFNLRILYSFQDIFCAFCNEIAHAHTHAPNSQPMKICKLGGGTLVFTKMKWLVHSHTHRNMRTPSSSSEHDTLFEIRMLLENLCTMFQTQELLIKTLKHVHAVGFPQTWLSHWESAQQSNALYGTVLRSAALGQQLEKLSQWSLLALPSPWSPYRKSS